MTVCLLCKKEVSSSGIRKHLFSGTHMNDIINSIHAKKKTYTSWLAKFDSSPQSCPFPKLYLTNHLNVSHDFCFPCKRFRDVRTNRPIECDGTHKKESAEFIRQCLAKEPTVPIVEEAPKPSIDEAALKRENTRLKAQLEASTESIEDGDALYSLLTHFHEHDEDMFKSIMHELKLIDPSVYERQIKQFEEEE